ncbi:MAG TPA: hydroxysqualene dehydroxylase HpnE [Dehalococcoidia bacterium]
MTERPAVLVAGGGLAGITAACELADAGLRVKLIEKRPYLGGRSYSYEADGVELDNGQHVFLGCCTEYIALLERLGVRDGVHLQRRFRVPVVDKVWGESVLQSAKLPPPAHLAPSLLRFRSLSLREKALAAYAFTQVRATDLAKHPELDDITFEQWLLERRQSRRAIRSLWNLIVQPTLNDHASRVSAALALMVFQEGFLRMRDGANVGWAKMGLSSLLAGAVREYIESRGGEVLTSVALNGLEANEDGISRGLTDAGEVTADAYVVALEPGAVPAVLPDSAREDRFFRRIGQISSSPIVNVHLWYERPIWGRAFAAFLNTPVQWVFNKSMLWRQDGPQYLDISLSGARDWVDVPAAEIRDHFEKEMQALFPAARGVDVRRALVVKQRDATFAAHPGVARLRPTQHTPLSNLFLAGDWTDTGWPATMESAVRSGTSAALQAMRSIVRAEKEVGAV